MNGGCFNRLRLDYEVYNKKTYSRILKSGFIMRASMRKTITTEMRVWIIISISKIFIIFAARAPFPCCSIQWPVRSRRAASGEIRIRHTAPEPAA